MTLTSIRKRSNNEQGFVLIASAVAAVVIFGMAGLAFDIGRMYITKNEAQTFADSASLYAAQKLDGTSAGLTNADNAVKNNTNAWNFATTAFDPNKTIVEYSVDGSTNWAKSSSVTSPATIAYVRVTAVVDNFPLFLLPATGYSGTTATIKAAAVAGQILTGGSTAPPPAGGLTPPSSTRSVSSNPVRTLFPYSPVSQVDGTSAATTLAADPTGNFGFTVGQQYDLKWPHSADLGGKAPCAGDQTQAMLNRTQNGQDWGEIQFTSASQIATAVQQITDDSTGVNINLDQSVNPTTGDKSSESKAFSDRAAQDPQSIGNDTLASYLSGPHNGRRLVTVVVNNGRANGAGTAYSSDKQAIAVGYAQFLLLSSYNGLNGSSTPWCAIYVGNSPAADTTNAGAGGALGQGVSVLRLLH